MPKTFLDSNIVYVDVEIADINKALLTYDRIQIWRSPDNIDPYQEITAEDDIAASIIGSEDGPWALTGTSLTIIKNSADPITISFTGTDPIDLQSLISYINQIIPDFASQAGPNINRLKLTSNLKGLRSDLTLSGSATSILGLSTTRVVGKSHRIELISPTTRYRFYDIDGAPTYYYKARFSSSINNNVSAFSPIIRATLPQIIPDNDLVTGSITLTSAFGFPVEGKRIIIVPITDTEINNAALLSIDTRIVIKTDQFGFASVKLPPGITARIFFEGTGFSREIIVPDQDFNILEAMTTYPDPFNIVSTPPMPIRLS